MSSSSQAPEPSLTNHYIQPPPAPPFVDIPGLPNFRDAGGYPVAADPAKIVRRGVLFRASEPSKITDQGIALLTRDLSIRHVYDLRSQTEIDSDTRAGSRQVREWAGSQRIFAPVFLQEDYSPEAIAERFGNFGREGSEGFVEVYMRILVAGADSSGEMPFARILRQLAGPTPSPMLVHCTAGKDRTGVLVALVLSLCGVPDEIVAHEYSLTELGLQERKDEFVGHLVSREPLLGRRAEAERMVSSRPESMAATLAALRGRWGSVDDYVRDQVGLSTAEIEAIRRNLIVDADGGRQAPVAWEEHAQLIH